MRLEHTCVGLLVKLANHYATRGTRESVISFQCIATSAAPSHQKRAQSAGAVEYTDWISAGEYGHPPPNECLDYDIKPFDGKAPILQLWVILAANVVVPVSVPFMSQIDQFENY